MFFVVTTGRSGSQTIARLLSQSPNCVCLHEPEPALVKEATLYEYGLIDTLTLRAILLSTRPKEIHSKVYGESNQKLSSLISLLAQIFPEAKFIWLVRDGRDVVASTYYARGWYQSAAELDLDRGQPYKKSQRDWIWYRLRGDLLGEMSTVEWEALSRFDKNCWLWNHTNQIIQQQLHILPAERWMLVRLETLTSQLESLCNFIGIESPPTSNLERHNASSRMPLLWEEWPNIQRQSFEIRCGEMMNHLYPSWQEPRDRQIRTNPPRKWWQFPKSKSNPQY